jgi:hypothetical protein
LVEYPNDFNVAAGRAMVSLGPLSPKRFCTYACAHCYVHAGFTKYPHLSIHQIIDYLRIHRSSYDIVYVSGDTDSFSKPRTGEGIALLKEIAELGCDVLFTTRAPLTDEDIGEIASVNRKLRLRGNLMFGCVSISRLYSAPHIEPRPVPSPELRIDVLRRLYEAGLVAVLAVRPFLPIIDVSEYREIVERCRNWCDLVLGESWYCDLGGLLEDMVLGKGKRLADDFVEKTMDFDSNGKVWRVYLGTLPERAVRAYCEQIGMPFFMRSGPAVELIRRSWRRGK